VRDLVGNFEKLSAEHPSEELTFGIKVLKEKYNECLR